jgi:sugar/nucleoside kinase (ribokinase family)
MSRVAVAGSINLDLSIWAGQLPSPGETVRSRSESAVGGGNQGGRRHRLDRHRH